METVNNTAMHVSETKTLCSSLNCPKTKNEDMTRQREEELLFGSNEDGDDEDALSDDSFRLRVSDEEQQTANRDAINEITKRESTETELGSDVPSSGITEREISLIDENLTNGNCTHDNYSSMFPEVKNENYEDFSSDAIPTRTNIFNNEPQDEFINDDSNRNANTSAEHSAKMQWYYSGHFGHHSKRGGRNPVGRQAYAMNSCSEKYYNQNTHYGRGRSCGRGYSLYHTREAGENSASRPNNAKSKEKSAGIATANKVSDETAKTSKVDSSILDVSCKNDVLAELTNTEISDSIVINTGVSMKNDNVEAALDYVNKADSASKENQEQNTSSNNSIPIIDREFNNVDHPAEKTNSRVIGDEAGVGSSVVESTNVDGNFMDLEDSSSMEIRSSAFEDKEKLLPNERNFCKGTNAGEEGNRKAGASEGTTENKDCDRESSLQTAEGEKGEVASGKTSPCTMNDEKIKSEIVNRSEDVEDVEEEAPKIIEGNEELDGGQRKKDSKNEEKRRSEELNVSDDNGVTSKDSKTRKDDEKSEGTNELSSNERVTSKNVEQSSRETTGKKSKVRALLKSDKVEIQETNNIVLIERNHEGEVKNDEVTKKHRGTLKAVKSTRELESRVEKQGGKFVDSERRQVTKDTPIVATVESKTVDVKTIFSIDHENTSESNVSLTDNENKDFSSSENNDANATMDKHDKVPTSSHCSLKRTSSELLLDEMELSKRIRIGRNRSEDASESSCRKGDNARVAAGNVTDEMRRMNKNGTSIVENTVTNSNGESRDSESEEIAVNTNVVEKPSALEKNIEETDPTKMIDDNNEKVDDCEVIEVSVKRKQKRSKRALNTLRENSVSKDGSQETETVRQKRKTAQNAEEMIRKEFSGNTDSDSNDSMSRFVTINHKTNNNLRAASPPTLKRSYVDDEVKNEGSTTKRLKADVTSNGDISTKNESIASRGKQTLRHVRNFFRRDPNGILCKLKQEELEELLIQKVVETLTMRDEIGKLREQAKVSERNQEATRLRCQQLAKQIKDFEMVLSRYKADLRMNPESKPVVPIKINRSVGLQVNFSTEHGIQNLRQLQQTQKVTSPVINGTTVVQRQQHQQQQQQLQQQKQLSQQQLQPQSDTSSSVLTAKRTVKVRSPRRPEFPVSAPVITAVSTPINSPQISTITPAALVVSKPVLDSRLSLTSANQQTTVVHPQLITSNQGVRVNGNVTNQPVRQAPTLNATKTKNSDLIDLTQEEDKTKVSQNTLLTAALNETSTGASNFQKIAPRFHTVIQTISNNMTLTPQQGIRVVQPSSQPTPTALVNNMNAPRLTYVTMQSGIVPRQVVLTSSPTPIRPAAGSNIRATFPISGTISNSAVRVIPTSGTPTILYKHPAALPESANALSSPSWKLPPPAPSLKISKVANGIVLSWNMALSDKYADIASYQLYAYQEVSGIPPSSSLWKKVGDVLALPLPMACTLTQFSEGNNYYFAVRAVDKHSRLGQYSQPGNISL